MCSCASVYACVCGCVHGCIAPISRHVRCDLLPLTDTPGALNSDSAKRVNKSGLESYGTSVFEQRAEGGEQNRNQTAGPHLYLRMQASLSLIKLLLSSHYHPSFR